MSPRLSVNIFFFINGFIFSNWAARIPRIQSDYGLDNKALGFVLLAHSIGAFIAMPITGWLINKYGSRKITLISGLFFPLFYSLIPFAPNFFIVLLPFFLMGAATGVMDVAMNAQAVFIEKDLGKPIMTMFHALFSIGMVAGGLSGGLFTTLETDLLLHFAVTGTVSLGILLFSSMYLFPDESNAIEDEVMFAWPKGPIVGLGVIAFCCMMGEGAMTDWSTNYMKNIVSVSINWQTSGLIAFASLMTLGRLVGDRGRTLIGDRLMMIIGSISSILGMMLIVTLLHPLLVITGFGLVGLGLSNIVPIVYSLAGTYPGIKPGVGIAMSTTIGYSGFMIGPPIIGFLADSFDLRIALVALGILLVVMFGLVVRYQPKKA